MKRSILINLFLIVLSIFGYSQKQILSFNPPEGFQYSTEFDIESTVNQTITGIERSINVSMLMLMDSYVMESTPEYCLIKLQYKKFSIESSDAFVSFAIDSETKNDNPGNIVFNSLIAKSFYAKFNRSGEVVEINGLDEIIADILKNIDPQDPIFVGYKKTLEESFGVNSLRQNFQQLSVAFPSYAIEINDSWNFNLDSKASDFDVQMNSTATIKSISKDNVIIQNNSTIVSTNTDTLDIKGMKGSIQMNGTSIAEIHIDPKNGLTKSGIVKQEINGELVLKTGETSDDEFRIPMKINSRIRVQNVVRKTE